ncbi:conserved hypothetical protein [Arthrobacter sp. Hiyo8]|nr:conserved hypothetical protein [Arthrobacter sp. Hiyo8]
MTLPLAYARLKSAPVAVVATLSMLLAGAGVASATQPVPAAASQAPAAAPQAPLTNLSHLNFLLDIVPLHAVEGHTTYQIGEHPRHKHRGRTPTRMPTAVTRG